MTPEKSWIRGVNLGGLFLLERFITPYFFALTTCHLKGDFRFYPQQIDAPPNTSSLYKLLDPNATNDECIPLTPYPVDEWTLAAAFEDKSIARKYLEIHYDNFVTKEDIDFLKQNGVTYVRVPLAHWITGNIADDEPYVDGAWPYFKRLVGWCRDAGIQVWPDIHTAPGSQNGFDNSGHLLGIPTCHGWDMDDPTVNEYNATLLSMNMGLGVPSGDDDVVLSNNVKRTLDIVNEITMAIAKDNMTDVVTGFGVLNEPFANCDARVVRKFDELSLDIVKRNMGSQTSVYIGDIFNSTKWNDGWWTDPKFKGTYLDSHYYHVFDERPRHLSPRQHIALVCQKNRRDTGACCYQDKDKRSVPSIGISRIIGEWSASLDTLVCDKLDAVMSGIRETGVAPEFDREISTERMSFLRNFAEAQMVAYEAEDYGVSSGWFYWTFKTEGGAFAEWNFMRGLKEGWMPQIPARNIASTDLYGSCYDILFKTTDDESIIHEFPDPNSLDANNWQGFPIDDDVVVSHGKSLKKDNHGEWYNPEEGGENVDQGGNTPLVHFLNRSSYWLIIFAIVSIIYILKKRNHKSQYIEITGNSEHGTLELLS